MQNQNHVQQIHFSPHFLTMAWIDNFLTAVTVWSKILFNFDYNLSAKDNSITSLSIRAILSLLQIEYYVKFYIYYVHLANLDDSDFPANCFVLKFPNLTQSEIQLSISKVSRAQMKTKISWNHRILHNSILRWLFLWLNSRTNTLYGVKLTKI